MSDLKLIQRKLLPSNLSQLTLTEVPCFESTEVCAQHCFENEWTLASIAQFALRSVYMFT